MQPEEEKINDINEEELINQPYFFGDISTEEAENLLRDTVKKVIIINYIINWKN